LLSAYELSAGIGWHAQNGRESQGNESDFKRLVRSGGPAQGRAHVGPPGLMLGYSCALFPDLTVEAIACRFSEPLFTARLRDPTCV